MTEGNDNQESTTENRDNSNNKKNVKNDEIWALLNYSKVRLATGTTPKEEEAQALVLTDRSGRKVSGSNKVLDDGCDDSVDKGTKRLENLTQVEISIEESSKNDFRGNGISPDSSPHESSYEVTMNDGSLRNSDASDSGGNDDDDAVSFSSHSADEDIPNSYTLYNQILTQNNNNSNDDELGSEDEDDEDEDFNDNSGNEDESVETQHDDDDNEEEEEEVEINLAEIAASRARAMAALARTRDLYGRSEEDSENEEEYIDMRRDYNNDILTSDVTAHSPEKTLTEKQLLKSMALAEQEAQRGASEFSTRKKLHLLDQISTPKGKDSSGRTGFVIGSDGKRKDLAIGSEIKKISQKAHLFWSKSKMRAEKAVKDIKINVAKIERQQQQISPRSHDEELKKEDSPLKRFTNTIAKVEKMNEQKYGHEIHFV
mmetsp:Transcript_14177/g.26609  ORF Transcript_14177/g.26609 Transcript_14177/m.26609 type:complete len:429 (+) Transcript_14177:83-1369(+)